MRELAERVEALSVTRLRLLNLCLTDGQHDSTGSPRLDVVRDCTAQERSIPRLKRRSEVELLARLDDMSDAQVDELLKELGIEQQYEQTWRSFGAARAGAIPRVRREREAELLARLPGLSDGEVDALLAELQPNANGSSE